jgi:hypothetical protein
MPVTFGKPDDTTLELCETALMRYHPDTAKSGLSWQVLMVFAPRDDDDKPKGPAMKKRGCQILMDIRINKLEARAKGLPSVTIRVDGDTWDEVGEKEKIARFDHEWTHIVWEGERDVDDMPKLAIREHDVEIGIFTEVIERHKEDATDLKIAKDAFDKIKQVYFQKEFWG